MKAVKVSPDGKTLVSCSADGTLKAWDMETEKLMYTCTGHKDEVRNPPAQVSTLLSNRKHNEATLVAARITQWQSDTTLVRMFFRII